MSTITQDVITNIEQLHQEGRSIEEICRFTGRSSDTVSAILGGHRLQQATGQPETRNALRLKSRNAIVAIVGERTAGNPGHGTSFLPTPEQIEAACLAIRETWSEAEQYSRGTVTPAAVRRPIAAPLTLEDNE